MKRLKSRNIRFSDQDWAILTVLCRLKNLKISKVVRDGAMERALKLNVVEEQKQVVKV